MNLISSDTRVFLGLGVTDMRKSINGLSALVEAQFDLDPFSGHLFVFSNRRRHIVKMLYWDRNGFCIWSKRLEKDRFKWPDRQGESLEIDFRQLNWLLDGLDFLRIKAHKRLRYSSVV